MDRPKLRIIKKSGRLYVDGRLAPALTAQIPLRIDQAPKCWPCKNIQLCVMTKRNKRESSIVVVVVISLFPLFFFFFPIRLLHFKHFFCTRQIHFYMLFPLVSFSLVVRDIMQLLQGEREKKVCVWERERTIYLRVTDIHSYIPFQCS